MTINGLPPSIPALPARPANATAPVGRPASEVAAADGQRARTISGASLWDVLTQEEKAFFLGASAGSLGYSPTGRLNDAEPVLGQRLDVRA